jgi:hypothetical protein
MEREPDDRLDVHNAAIDNEIAGAHLCAMTDLRTGRTCIKAVHHDGSCEFVSKTDARRISDDLPSTAAEGEFS